jgi:hypothetical protein
MTPPARFSPGVVLEFYPHTPGRIEVRRNRESWFVFDREIDDWKPITEAVARVLNSITADIERGSS